MGSWLVGAALLAVAVAGIAAAIISIEFGRGRFVIETADDEAAVAVNASGVKLIDLKNDRSYLLKPGSRRLPDGDYEIVVAELPEGVEFTTTRFQLRRGKTVRATARYVVNADPGDAAKPAIVPSNSPIVGEVENKTQAPGELDANGPKSDWANTPDFPRVQPGEPLSPTALVSHPAPIAGLRSWSIEFPGHRKPIAALAVAPDSSWFATGGPDGICIWESDGRLRHLLMTEQVSLNALSASPDGRFLASCAHEPAGMRIWDVQTGRLVRAFAKGLRQAVWLRGGTQIATPEDLQFVVHDLSSGEVRRSAENPDSRYVQNLTISPDEKTFAALDSAGRVGLWDATSLTQLKMGPAPDSRLDLTRIEYSADGKYLAASVGHGIHIYDSAELKLLHKFGNYSVGAAWSRTGHRLAFAGGGTFVVNLDDPDPAPRQITSDEFEHCVAWMNDSDLVLCGLRGPCLLNVMSGQRSYNHALHAEAAAVAQFVSVDRTRVQTYDGSRIRRWSIDRGELIDQTDAPWGRYRWGWTRQFETAAVTQLDGEKYRLGLYDAATWELKRQTGAFDQPPTAIAFSPDGSRFVTTDERGVFQVWSSETATVLSQLKWEGPPELGHVVWSADGALIAGAVGRQRLLVWDGLDFRLLHDVSSPVPLGNWKSLSEAPLAFSPDKAELGLSLNNGCLGSLNLSTLRQETQLVASHTGVSSCFWLPRSADEELLFGIDFAGYLIGFNRRTGQSTRRILGGRGGFLRDAARVCLGTELCKPLFAVDVLKGERHGVLFPSFGEGNGHFVCIGPEGHYRGSRRVESHLVCVAMHEDGSQKLYSLEEFAQKFQWQNDPRQARLFGLPAKRPDAAVLSENWELDPVPNAPRTTIAPDPDLSAGKTVYPGAMVTAPPPLPGLKSWTIEFREPITETRSNYTLDQQVTESLAWSPAGDALALTSSDYSGLTDCIHIYDRKLQLRRLLLRHSAERFDIGENGRISALGWSPDGKSLVSGDPQGHVCVWNAADGQLLRAFTRSRSIRSALWSPRGDSIALSADGNSVELIDPDDGHVKQTPGIVASARTAWSPEGLAIAIPSGSEVCIWDLAMRGVDLRLHAERAADIEDVAWSSNGRWIAATTRDHRLVIWDANSGQQVADANLDADERRLAFSPHDARLCTVGRRCRIWTLTAKGSIAGAPVNVRSDAYGLVSWSPDGEQIAVLRPDSTVLLCDADDGRLIAETHRSARQSRVGCTLNLDRRTLLLGSGEFDATNLRFDASTPLEAGRYYSQSRAGGRWMFVDDIHHAPTTIFDTEKRVVSTWTPHDRLPRTFGVSGNGRLIATGGEDGTLRIWNCDDRSLRSEIALGNAVLSVGLSDDGRFVAAQSADRSVACYEIETKQRLWKSDPLAGVATFSGPSRLDWNPNGKLLAAAYGSSARVFDSETGKFVRDLGPLPVPTVSIAWNRAGNRLAVVGYTWALIWDLELDKVDPISNLPDNLTWLPDNRTILSGAYLHHRKVVFDAVERRVLSTLTPLDGNEVVVINGNGHYGGSMFARDYLVYVAVDDEGRQQAYTPDGFEAQFGWKNDPAQATFIPTSAFEASR
jgi:WD40 repeat protein